MATITRVERRKRGFFGWIFLLAFWGFNLLMLVSMIGSIGSMADQHAALTTQVERDGFAVGSAIGFSVVLLIWALGAIILGLAAWLTAGRKVTIETTSD